MLIPFRDDNPTRTFPIIVVLLIAANVLVYVYQALLPEPEEIIFVYTHGAIPLALLGKATVVEVLPRQARLAAMIGAIAGVLGAYYVKFPNARVQCLVFLCFFVTVAMLPAGLVLLLWFLLQVLSSLQPSAALGAPGGVAVFAHIGGFMAGWALARRFEPRRRPLRFIQW
jgi:membrane associated rhomboid family serine protease